MPTIAIAAPMPSVATAAASPGANPGLRSSRTADQTLVVATVPERTSRAQVRDRRRHRSTLPIPTRAPIAGASATV